MELLQDAEGIQRSEEPAGFGFNVSMHTVYCIMCSALTVEIDEETLISDRNGSGPFYVLVFVRQLFRLAFQHLVRNARRNGNEWFNCGSLYNQGQLDKITTKQDMNRIERYLPNVGFEVDHIPAVLVIHVDGSYDRLVLVK
jgi:hypothetical protein